VIAIFYVFGFYCFVVSIYALHVFCAMLLDSHGDCLYCLNLGCTFCYLTACCSN